MVPFTASFLFIKLIILGQMNKSLAEVLTLSFSVATVESTYSLIYCYNWKFVLNRNNVRVCKNSEPTIQVSNCFSARGSV